MTYNHILVAIILFLVSFAPQLPGQDHAFILYNNQGQQITFEDAASKALEYEIVLFGEYHDQPLCHWLQKEFMYYFHDKKSTSFKIGMEMFESDNQLIIDEYFSDLISQKKFEAEVRLWNNYKTDYKDILEYSKAEGIPFIATNVPGRYANSVFTKGIDILEKLDDKAKGFIPPLPLVIDLTIPSYAKLLEMGGGGHAPDGENFPNAQALRDATMAYFILKNFNAGDLVLHLNGSYHSDSFEGINIFLQQYRPNTKVFVISTVYQKDINSLNEDHFGKADVIICIPETMNRSY